MKAITCLVGSLVVGLVLLPPSALAQFVPYPGAGRPNQYNRPAVSPFLNLLRPGASPAFNYYTLVRPQQLARNEFQQLEQQNTTLQQDLSAQQQQTEIVTGYHSQFQTQSKYFFNNATGAVGVGRGLNPIVRPTANVNQGPRPRGSRR